MRPNVFAAAALAAALASTACAPRPDPILITPQQLSPEGAPSAVPLPLPTYPYEPGFWV